jgi:hypothetical protein
MNNSLHEQIIKNPSVVGLLYNSAKDLDKLLHFKESTSKSSLVKIDRKTQSIIEKLKDARRSSIGPEDFLDYAEMAKSEIKGNRVEWSEKQSRLSSK